MKFVTFEIQTPLGPIERAGLWQAQIIIDLNAVYAAYLRQARGIWRWRELAQAIVPPTMLKFIEGGELSLEAARLALDHFEQIGRSPTGDEGERLCYDLSEVRLLAPVPRPVAIRDGMAFFQHIHNMARTEKLPALFYELPAHYRTSTTTVVGPDAPILWPSYTERLDYELEFAVCIGRPGVNIPAEKAVEHIFGYTIFNDISARDIQFKEMELKLGPAKGKNFQNSNIMGPCLVTPDELDVDNLRMTARVNGELWSEGHSGTMHFKFPDLIAHFSQDDPLAPGEFIGSGTVGFGCGAELNKWLQPGDVIELEVEGIGILKNRVERRS